MQIHRASSDRRTGLGDEDSAQRAPACSSADFAQLTAVHRRLATREPAPVGAVDNAETSRRIDRLDFTEPLQRQCLQVRRLLARCMSKVR